MILDVEQAVMDYLAANMNTLTGGTGASVDIERRRFHEDSGPVAVAVYAEDGDSDEIPGLNEVTVRITVRATRGRDAFTLMGNADRLLDLMVRKQFNAGIECMGSQRNTRPQPVDGGNNALAHYTCLYEMLFRRIA